MSLKLLRYTGHRGDRGVESRGGIRTPWEKSHMEKTGPPFKNRASQKESFVPNLELITGVVGIQTKHTPLQRFRFELSLRKLRIGIRHTRVA